MMIGFIVGLTDLAVVGALFAASSWPRNSDTEFTLPRTLPRMIQGPRPVSGFPSLNILALIRGVA